jgi:hypothetical protein
MGNNNSPYKFLDFFSEKDKEHFFGREQEINLLVADIMVSRLVVLFAKTGTGKTSLINAGVRPELEDQEFRTFYIRVEKDPAAAARAVLQAEQVYPVEAVDLPLSKVLGLVVKDLGMPIVLFFDQFEEFFLQILDPETRQKFITDIATTYRDEESGVHLVFSMREEYFHDMDEFRPEIPSIFHKNSNLRLLPLKPEQAEKAIVEPARAQNVKVEPGLVAALVNDLKEGGYIPPTRLQIVCDTLWQDEQRDRQEITLEDYHRWGSVQQILDQRLERDIEQKIPEPELLALLQKLIPWLHTNQGTKHPRLISDLLGILATEETVVNELIERLKGIHVIKDMTISGAKAIEWTSDYLAERTEYLLARVQIIELRHLLRQSMDRAKELRSSVGDRNPEQAGYSEYSGYQTLLNALTEKALTDLYLPADHFERLSENVQYLAPLDVETAAIMLDAALFHGRFMKLWFEQATVAGINPWDILQKRIQERQSHINLRLGAVSLLAELGSEQAIQLLGEALNEPDLALEVVEILAHVPGEAAARLIATALEREDLWEAVLFSLTRSATERDVTLLAPLLKEDEKFFPVFRSLERLSKSSGPAGSKAGQEVLAALPRLEYFLGQEEPSYSLAYETLENLAKSSEEEIKTRAGTILEATRTAQKGSPPKSDTHQTSQAFEKSAKPTTSARDWDRTAAFIGRGRFLPILSGDFLMEQVFRPFFDQNEPQEGLSITERISQVWSDRIEYPFPNTTNLAAVAEYHRVEQREEFLAKQDFLDFLKTILLDMSTEKPGHEEKVSNLQKRSKEMPFTEIVRELGYPRSTDSLQALARFPIPIYITTSPFTFLEEALRVEGGKSPVPLACNWNGNRSTREEDYRIQEMEPSVAQPLVYHLFGLEQDPESLVLSTDDYINFLWKIAGDTDTISPLIPLQIRHALAVSQVLLVGYRVRDWDLRILLSLLAQYREKTTSQRGIYVQPFAVQSGEEARAAEYLSRYFDLNRFTFDSRTSDEFLGSLWQAWKGEMNS